MQTRKLGQQGFEVGALGLGCMGMSEFCGQGDEAESIATIHRALELGITLLDAGAADVSLSPEELDQLASAVPAGVVSAERYDSRGMTTVNR